MNKKSTLLAAALMAVSSLTVSAVDTPTPVPSTEWTAGNYYYLKTVGNKYLSLCKEKQDSVIVVEGNLGEAKIDKDLALWEITAAKTETTGVSYQLKNKKTKAVLSFEKDMEADPILNSEGVSLWSLTKSGEGYVIKSQLTANEVMELQIDVASTEPKKKNKIIFKDGNKAVFQILKPEEKFPLDVSDLGNGFSTFQLSFGEELEGDIFSGKDLIATAKEEGYMWLQEKGNEAKGYFGIDTLITPGASYKFSLDSIRTTVRPNEEWKLFKFTADLKNDSLTMMVKGTPTEDTKDVKVVYARLDNKKVLTVTDSDGGVSPFITTSRGVPATISTGTGVYLLKSASKGVNGGKYYVTQTAFMGGDSVPSPNLPRGQWYIKEEHGRYSVYDRESNDEFIKDEEVFEVTGMEDTYLFGEDSVTVIAYHVDFDDKHLGSLAFTEQELADKGFTLHLIPGTPIGPSYLYTFTTDSILKETGPDAISNQIIFKLVPGEAKVVAGAQALGDTISIIPYKLRTLFGSDSIALQGKDSLKLSSMSNALSFYFASNDTKQWYTMQVVNRETEKGYVGMDIQTGCLQLTKNPAKFTILSDEAPEYASFENGHKRFSYNNNSLVMNPNTFFAEMKNEDDVITKANYEEDNFSLWVEKAENSPVGKPLYYISCKAPETKAGEATRYYLAVKDTLDKTRALFISHDSIKTMENSPALFAFKLEEGGGFHLENQSELKKDSPHPYIGMENGLATMWPVPVAAFTIEAAQAPVANEDMEAPTAVKVLGGVGEFSIRNADGKKIVISNILGQTIGSRVVSSDYVTIPTMRGVVIVSVEGDQAYKVIVK